MAEAATSSLYASPLLLSVEGGAVSEASEPRAGRPAGPSPPARGSAPPPHPAPAPLASRLALLAASLSLAGCLTAHPRTGPAPPAPTFAPDQFFAGHTRGLGVLSVRLKSPELLCVNGYGEAQPDGTFRLDQTITHPDGRTEERTWTMRQESPAVWTASLTDAAGEVTAEVEGSELLIRYRIGSPSVTMRQRLVVQPDGQTALNLSTVSALGVPVARLQEVIERRDTFVPCAAGAAPPRAAGGAEDP